MTSSPIKNELAHNYVDHGPIIIPIKFKTNTPNNKEVTVREGGVGFTPPANLAPKIALPG